jgi:hypothetical protein
MESFRRQASGGEKIGIPGRKKAQGKGADEKKGFAEGVRKPHFFETACVPLVHPGWRRNALKLGT